MSSKFLVNKPRVSIIAAIGRNREIGGTVDGKADLLWHIPEDFKHFKKTTMGKPIIMGSTTYESIGSALPGRLNIVLSHDREYVAKGCIVVHSLDEAVEIASEAGTDEIFIIGGGFVYKQALEIGMVDRMYLTLIDADFPQADVFFPEYQKVYGFTKIIEQRDGKGETTEKSKTFSYKFVTLEHNNINKFDGV